MKKLSTEKIKNLTEQMKFVPQEHSWFYEKAIAGGPDDKDEEKKNKKQKLRNNSSLIPS